MTTSERRVIRARMVLRPGGLGGAAAVHIEGGVITRVTGFDDVEGGGPVTTLERGLLMPGAVDTHVHINEPGRTHWEGFETATRAAAAGGVTTLVDMPLNCIPATTNTDALHAKIAASHGKLAVDVGFWGGVVPGNIADLEPLIDAGALGFKCFMVPSGVDEFEWVKPEHLERAMPILARRGATLLAHAEVPGPVEAASTDVHALSPEARRIYANYMATRPPAAELEAIDVLIDLAERTGCHVHVVHLATAEAVERLRRARAAGVPITVETCQHYLTFCASDVLDGDTAFKCAPPIRAAANRDGLRAALAAGVIDLVATDHSPSPGEVKNLDTGDFISAWGGVASLQLAVTALWTVARDIGATPHDLTRWIASEPARLAGLTARKGNIAVGADADLVHFDPEASAIVSAASLHHRHPLTPYDGRTLYGKVERTWLRGRQIFDGARVTAPHGQVILGSRGG